MGGLDDIWKNLCCGAQQKVWTTISSQAVRGAGFLVICFTSQFIKTLISGPRRISILEL